MKKPLLRLDHGKISRFFIDRVCREWYKRPTAHKPYKVEMDENCIIKEGQP
jgi:hypothetical protein